jgi:RHS repeat-associated protein
VYRYDLSNRLIEASRYAKTPEDAQQRDGTDAHHRYRRWIGKTLPEMTAQYRYDAFGRRTVKQVMQPDGNTDTTVFVWDGDVLLMEERFRQAPRKPMWPRPVEPQPKLAPMVREDPADAYSLPVAQRTHALKEPAWQGVSLYLHEPGTFVPLARIDETLVEPAYLATGTDGRLAQVPARTAHTTLFYLNDHLGTPQELVDDAGNVVWMGRYRAWGAPKTVWQEKPLRMTAANPLRFQGQYHDDETGLHYNRHRYYDPHSGRFISRDPIGLVGGINAYQYAPNPITWIDPLGLTAACDLPRFRGRSVAQINEMLSDAGFNLDKQTSTGNQTWSHSDGSQVRVDPYGNQSMTMKNGQPLPKSGANAHAHKYDPGQVTLNDRGIPSIDPDETHIGIKNPKDYPAKRGRPHGCGA